MRADAKEGWNAFTALYLRAMELASVILQTMGQAKAPILIHHQDNLLLSLMVEFGTEKNTLARHSVFGLFGDIQKWILDSQGTFVQELVGQCVANVQYDEDMMSAAGFSQQSAFMQEYGSGQFSMLTVCTNAVWALGECAVKATEDSPSGDLMKQVMIAQAPQIASKIVTLLSVQKLNKTLA